ncbi:hypothetical protein LTR85_005885 [Meristemomyces frigidus]|nr:hypothetical protein LTR85_005885 [Meristemomyces frigidus]
MSFGFSPADIISLVTLTTKTYHGWRDACGEYTDVTGTLNSLRVVLERVDTHFKKRETISALDSSDKQPDHEHEDLHQILDACKGAVAEFNGVVARYSSLSSSRSRNWERIRLGNKDLSKLRAKLNQHVTNLSAYLLTVQLESIDRVTEDMATLPDLILQGLPVALGALIDARGSDGRSTRVQ